MEDKITPEGYKRTIVFRKDKKGGIQIPVDFGDYQIIEEFASGGMGVIYKALHKKLDVIHALKVLDPIYSKDEDFVRNFKREAQLAARLKHPNIMIVHDTGEFAGFHYIAMEFIEGKNLADIGKAPVSVALSIVTKICDALDHAHNKELIYEDRTQYGVIHRDIKPENIMIEQGGEVKLMDFGIARCAQVVDQTTAGTIKGTVPYMSPEQLDGRTDIDHRTDIYSLGVVLYELLSGRKAFTGTQTSIFSRISRHEYEPLDKLDKSIPKEIVDIVDKAMTYNREERFASAFEMRLEISKYLAAYRYQDLNTLIKDYLERREAPQEVVPKKTKKGLKTFLVIAGALLIIFLAYWGIDSLLYSRSKGKAENALSNLEEKINATQERYRSMNLAAIGDLQFQTQDDFTSEDFKSVVSLCDSASQLIDGHIRYYRDSTWSYLTTVDSLFDKIEDQKMKDEIDVKYIVSAKDLFDSGDYDSTNTLLALAYPEIKRALKQKRKTSSTQVVRWGKLTVTCLVNSNYVRCDIFVDGKPTGKQTPYTLDLKEGWHEIKLTYQSWEKSERVHIKGGETKKLSLELTETANPYNGIRDDFKNSDLSAELRTNKDKYYDGDTVLLYYEANDDCYSYMLDFYGEGNVDKIIDSQEITKNKEYKFTSIARYAGVETVEILKLIVADKPLDIEMAMSEVKPQRVIDNLRAQADRLNTRYAEKSKIIRIEPR
jgi:serine/threonine protein kinase